MAKTLVLVRHSKSAWPDDVPDHDRPLADRGRRDAPAIGRWLAAQGCQPDIALVSSAARTRETFALLTGELPEPVREVITEHVYAASTGTLLDLVRVLDDAHDTVLIVGHNPSIGMLAALLDSRQAGHFEFKTSATAIYEMGVSWDSANPGTGRLVTSAIPRG